MFSTLGLFKQINCPQGAQCKLPQCMFLHDTFSSGVGARGPSETVKENVQAHADLEFKESDRPRKKQRISEEFEIGENDAPIQTAHSSATRSTSNSTTKREDSPRSFEGTSLSKKSTSRTATPNSTLRTISPPHLKTQQQITTTNAKISSLPNGHHVLAEQKAAKDAKQVRQSLNPRLLQKPPATHDIRLKLITFLHEQMVRLNKEIQESQDDPKHALELSPNELIIQALDEEEQIAKENPTVYLNVLKLRIGSLKKMKLDTWKKERLKQIAKGHPEPAPPQPASLPITIDTGLSPAEEISILPKLLAQQADLAKHGYVPCKPTPTEVSQARDGVQASHNWEVCDRCKSRFQVFPGRREEDGALTTGGKCTYHYGRARRPPKEKTDTGPKDMAFTCCGELLGTAGCTTADTHVFKVSETKRLELVMPFLGTPVEGVGTPKSAVCFDCEMGYTTLGMELIRLTATEWPGGGELLDVLVRPMGEVLDLNSRFSGVWPRHFAEAVPYGDRAARCEELDKGEFKSERLLMVESPAKARELLFEHLTTTTPLIGHAIENDLNATRIIHPSIIDTVLLFPHPRGLPIRHGLKMLVKKYLNRDIQMGGAQGHDSKEDARAAGDLVRVKVAEIWKVMKREGWTVRKGEFFPPMPEGQAS